MYTPTFDQDWPNYFNKLDSILKKRVAKKIKGIIGFPKKRHLKKRVNFFVDEMGQHRIIYRVFDKNNEARFYFVGNHKQYEKWLKKQ